MGIYRPTIRLLIPSDMQLQYPSHQRRTHADHPSQKYMLLSINADLHLYTFPHYLDDSGRDLARDPAHAHVPPLQC